MAEDAVNIQPFQVLNWSQLLHDTVGSAAPTNFRTLEHPVSNWPFNSLVTSWMTLSFQWCSLFQCSSGDESTSLNHSLFEEQNSPREGSFYRPTLAGVCMVWLMPTAPPSSAQLLSWWGFSVGKGMAPSALSEAPPQQSVSSPCCMCSGIDYWFWQILIILEALLNSTRLCFWKSGTLCAPKIGNELHGMY